MSKKQVKEEQVSKDVAENTAQVREAEAVIEKEVARLKKLLKQQSKNEVIRVAIGQMIQYSELQQAAHHVMEENKSLFAKLAKHEEQEKKESK